MHTGEMIEQLMDMVARAEEHAHTTRFTEMAIREEEFTSRFIYAPDARPMMIGVV
ncbi:MAG: hypothetical protein LAO06_03560 [Acidobacteriia bacterium]|nr:hypothetical protein [Terriglobia bacterium]